MTEVLDLAKRLIAAESVTPAAGSVFDSVDVTAPSLLRRSCAPQGPSW